MHFHRRLGAIELSRATYRKMIQNLVWATAYNVVAIPVGAGVFAFGGPATYNSKTNFAYGDVNWKPIPRLTLKAGYAGSFANGNTLFLNPNAPLGPLQYIYQQPYAGFAYDLAKGFTFKTTWTYYGYNPKSAPNPAGLAPIGRQDFKANNVTLALRYSF